MTIDLILGTAGHIDHGKTSLIRVLTGVDTDRLPEEKKRGITIELGFAELTVGEYRLGIVDVPGHERFVRNMLAGATGMDLAMLVVAADDSINRQTREHFDILRMLDLPAGVIAITKSDLVDADWIELVEEEVRELVAESFLENAPIVRTSAATGQGIAELQTALAEAAQTAAAARATVTGPFRMAIDRCFTIAGHGTVVTGSVGSGRVCVGDELVIEPDEVTVRVRGLQNHDRMVDEVHRGQRAAINLAGIHHDLVRRGHELATPGHLHPTRRLTVSVDVLPDAPHALKNRKRIRLHVGTAEVLATVRLLQGDALAPGTSGFAQLFLTEPVVVTWNQPFVLRMESPLLTIGGGRIIDPNAPILKRPSERAMALLEQWQRGAPLERAAAAAYFSGVRGFEPEALPRMAGIPDFGAIASALEERGDLIAVPVSPTRVHRIHRLALVELADRIEQRMARLHRENPLRSVLDTQWVTAALSKTAPEPVIRSALAQLRREKKVRETPRGIALVGHAPKLSQNEAKLLDWLCQRYREAKLQAPRISELQKEVERNQQSIPQLVAIAVADGDLVEIGDDLVLHRETVEDIKETLRSHWTPGEGLTLSQIRELLGTTRKYAVPLCEYLDRTGFTKREGDLRFLA